MGESTARQPNVRREWRTDLAELIGKHLKVLLAEANPTVKIPELLKMIELHAKGEPQNSETKEFWDFIENLRRRKQAERDAAAQKCDQLSDRTGGKNHAPTVPDPAAARQ